MSKTEINRIINLLQNSYDGASWHGASIMEILNRISSQEALHPSAHIHRICELVQHMITWRNFAIKKFEGDDKYEVTQSEDWIDFSKASPGTWDTVKLELSNSQQHLIRALEKFNDDKLEDGVPGKSYDFYTLAHGVIQHDLYHLGEIALLSRELKE